MEEAILDGVDAIKNENNLTTTLPYVVLLQILFFYLKNSHKELECWYETTSITAITQTTTAKEQKRKQKEKQEEKEK